MKLFWTSFKISIAGAKLSHLVQKDKIWDHGTMVEQVKNIFYKIEKAKAKGDPEFIRKNLTANAYLELAQIIQLHEDKPVLHNALVTAVSIIEVKEKKNPNPDQFTALIKGNRKGGDSVMNFSERWQFVREGDWWLLDEIK